MLSDNLAAPASVSRDPHPVYAIRIGKVRDGSKTGVLAYAQEHAREWVPPLVTIETAERLLRNYATHGPTKQLVNNLDIWIVPSVNPDGGHYSFHDFASQRKNMTRYCEPTGNYDVNARTTWGVDNNRNYDQYSLFDGFSGASSSCTSGTYAGPSELSEPENGNVDWIASKPNIKFRDEPALVGQTLDGSTPTYSSPMYASAGIREGGELLQVPSGTTVHWFSVDSAGNVERNYVPNGKGKNFGKGVAVLAP